MNISLPPELNRYVKQQVESGAYDSVGAVVRAALSRQKATEEAARGFAPGVSLGDLGGADIEALLFVVLMEAAKSAQEDLKAIMAKVKAMTAAKQELRCLMSKVNKDVAANAGCKPSNQRLKFAKNGLGGERAYHRAQLPFVDPEAQGGVRLVECDLCEGTLSSFEQLQAIQDKLQDKLDSLSELSDIESLRLQMALDRRAKALETLSNVLKKCSATQASITQNIK